MATLPFSLREIKPLNAIDWLVTSRLSPQVHVNAKMAAEVSAVDGMRLPWECGIQWPLPLTLDCLIWDYGSQLSF